jgi:imidazoleglycerol-phosphate dehydratase/histidinol-phosphatase
MHEYAFLDRDGTFLIEPERPPEADPRETFPLKSLAEFRFMDGAIDGLKELTDKGYGLVMATNQTFLGTPKHPRETFDSVMDRLHDELATHGIRFEFVMVCPHGPDEGCDCRKPKTGGLTEFLRENKPDLEHSLMFGDRDTDREFAENLGVRFVRIETNKKFEVPKDV